MFHIRNTSSCPECRIPVRDADGKVCCPECAEKTYPQPGIYDDASSGCFEAIITDEQSLIIGSQSISAGRTFRPYIEKMREKSPQAYFRWSPQEEDQLLSALARRMTVREIAQQHGRSRGAINSRIRRLAGALNENRNGLLPEKAPLSSQQFSG